MGCGRNDSMVESTMESNGVGGTIIDGRCVCDVVRAIKDIQDQFEDECGPCPTSCFNTPLGNLTSPANTPADTRVFMLLTKDGTPFKAFFRDRDRCDNDCWSVFFRVEDIFGRCCATLRVLEPRDRHGNEVNLLDETKTKIDLSKICKVVDWDATGSCITVDLDCFCAVECIADVFLGICD